MVLSTKSIDRKVCSEFAFHVEWIRVVDKKSCVLHSCTQFKIRTWWIYNNIISQIKSENMRKRIQPRATNTKCIFNFRAMHSNLSDHISGVLFHGFCLFLERLGFGYFGAKKQKWLNLFTQVDNGIGQNENINSNNLNTDRYARVRVRAIAISWANVTHYGKHCQNIFDKILLFRNSRLAC